MTSFLTTSNVKRQCAEQSSEKGEVEHDVKRKLSIEIQRVTILPGNVANGRKRVLRIGTGDRQCEAYTASMWAV